MELNEGNDISSQPNFAEDQSKFAAPAKYRRIIGGATEYSRQPLATGFHSELYKSLSNPIWFAIVEIPYQRN